MNNLTKKDGVDRKKVLRRTNHLTRPPRLEGNVKNVMMKPVRKTKKRIRPKKRKDNQ